MATAVAEDRPADPLRADCASCVGLCCVALAFGTASGFAFDKEAGEPCTHLQDDFRCRIHPVLTQRGFPGCTIFDCQGAGQKVTQVTFAGRSWRDEPGSRELMFATFQVMRPLHELLCYLDDARTRPEAVAVHVELTRTYDEIDALTRQGPDDVIAVDLAVHRTRVQAVLSTASALVRAAAREQRPSRTARRARPGADLAGADLSGQDLRGTDLRGAHLMAADLRDSDLRGADLIGADLRDALVSGTDLSSALYLTQFQVNSARGSDSTRLPPSLARPGHWTA